MHAQATSMQMQALGAQVQAEEVPPEASAATEAGSQWPLSFHGVEKDFFSRQALNLLLTVLTLGGFLFWAKTQQRHYLYGQTAVAGHRFFYHGTGRELLLGWLKAVLIFYLPLLLINVTLAGLQAWLALPEAIFALAVLPILFLQIMCFAAARVGARRYRLSRTSLRSLRFSFRGPVRDFVELYVAGVFFTVLTLGLYYPWFATRLQLFLVSHTYFGSRAFAFSGRERDLLPYFARALLLSLVSVAAGWWLAGMPSVVVALLWAVGVLAYFRESLRKRPYAEALVVGAVGLGIGIWYAGAGAGAGVLTAVALVHIWCGYAAAQQRYFWSHTTFDALHFQSTVTGDGLFRLLAGNLGLFLAVTASAGILVYLLALACGADQPAGFLGFGFLVWAAFPWTVLRNTRFTVRHLATSGDVDLTHVTQEHQAVSATGEGLAGLFNLGGELA